MDGGHLPQLTSPFAHWEKLDSYFGLLQMEFVIFRFVDEHKFSLLWDKCPGVQLNEHTVNICSALSFAF